MYEQLLDIIQTHDREFKGLVDFATKKQVIFYNFADNPNVSELLVLAILWKLEAPGMRFSVYRAKYYPHVPIESPMVISKKSITSEHDNITTTHINRVVKRLTIR